MGTCRKGLPDQKVPEHNDLLRFYTWVEESESHWVDSAAQSVILDLPRDPQERGEAHHAVGVATRTRSRNELE
jgi:hypothetical protein